MKILIAASEAVPFIKTGGLADVTGALFREYTKMGVEAWLMLPLYSGIKESFDLRDTGRSLNVPLGDRQLFCKLWSYESNIYFIENDEFFDRTEPYGTAQGDYPDNAARFIFFSMAILEACMAVDLRPDVLHCNDWQTGLIPLYLKTLYNNVFFADTATVMTIHNLGYQGVFDISEFYLTGLGWEWFNPEGIEFYGKVNFLKAGLIAADIITTVSDTYAGEILTTEHGYGLEGVLKNRQPDLYGVINGISSDEWDPATDKFIAKGYSLSDITGKALCKKKLMEECSFLSEKEVPPLIAMVGRLSTQKGLDMLINSLDEILLMGARLVALGKGDQQFHSALEVLAEKYKGSVFIEIGYDEPFAHRIYAGSDIFLMPSRYEPCGLGQLIAMRYGTIPVARKTGGLADTITDYNPLKGDGTGFLFEDYRASALRESLRSALCVYADKMRWNKLVANAMRMDFSWQKSAGRYVELYNMAMQKTH